MNSSYDEVLRASTSTWRFQRLELVLEFSRKKIAPFNIPMLCIRLFVAILWRWLYLDSLYKFLNDSSINSDLNRFLKAFSNDSSLDYDDMYRDDGKMAALFNDIHGERPWISSFEHHKDQHAEKLLVTQKADFVRDCAELVMAMCDKLADSQKKEDAHDAELRAVDGAGRHLNATDLEIRRLKKQLSSEISSVKGDVRVLMAECRQHTEAIAAIKGQLAETKTRMLPLPRIRHDRSTALLGGQR
jgi:hypothetical protein